MKESFVGGEGATRTGEGTREYLTSSAQVKIFFLDQAFKLFSMMHRKALYNFR